MMQLTDISVLFLMFSAYFGIFLLGYLIGKTNGVKDINSVVSVVTNRNVKNSQNIIEKMQTVAIDDSKFVGNIDTSDMEKKYDNIAPSVEINDNIDQSVNKLSSLIKGK